MYHDHLGRFSGANGVRGALQACTRVRDLRMCCFLGANMSPESNGDVWFKYNVGKAITNHPYFGSFMALILPPMLKLEMPFYSFTNYQCNIESNTTYLYIYIYL